MTIQRRNPELSDLLRPDLLHRGESFFALQASFGAHMMIPHLRGFWPMSRINHSAGCLDASGFGNTLAVGTGTVTYGINGLCPYADLTSGYLTVTPATPGPLTSTVNNTLTLGCWVRVSTIPTGYAGIMGVWSDADGYYILRMDDDVPTFSVVQATTPITFSITASAIGADTWHFMAGRYEKAAQRQSIWVDDVESFRTDSTSAGLNITSGVPFYVGAWNGNNNRLDGDVALPWVSAAALPDASIHALRLVSKPFFYPA